MPARCRWWRTRLVTATAGLWLCLSPLSAGVLDLGPEDIVQAGGSDVVVVGSSVPSYADWDSDGRMDLVVGEGS